MDNGTVISIIIPAYNVEGTIAKTLESIICQTYKNIEIIAVDDGANDHTGEILDYYAQKYKQIKVIHELNQGVTTARLNGIAKATGEWIGFVDGDDLISPDMYEVLLNNAIKYHAKISHCGYQMIFPDKRIHYFYNTGDIIEQDRNRGLRDLLEGTIIEPSLWNKLFHKSLFEDLLKNGFPDKSIRINEDLLMNYCLFLKSELSVFYDVCKYYYIVRNGSASRSKLDEHRIYDPIKVRKIILQLSPQEVRNDAKKAYLSSCINVYNGLVLEKDKTLKNDQIRVKQYLINHRNWFFVLNRKQKILGYLILRFTWCYKYIYRFYARVLLKNPYE